MGNRNRLYSTVLNKERTSREREALGADIAGMARSIRFMRSEDSGAGIAKHHLMMFITIFAGDHLNAGLAGQIAVLTRVLPRRCRAARRASGPGALTLDLNVDQHFKDWAVDADGRVASLE